MIEIVLVLTTLADDDRAEPLARTLVDERLAACVNLLPPMTSIYRWKDRVERDAERQLVIKTTRDRLQALKARLQELHSYELPEFVVLNGEASAGYGEWLRDSVTSPKP
jgi:periplasmic divalent cation tolerance protein